MKIANIYPISNQLFYSSEEYVMILAHLLKKGGYCPQLFQEKQWIILDNGLFENQQVSTDLNDLIQLAENSGIPVKEIIIPDTMKDPQETKELFERNYDLIVKWSSKYKFMFVLQAAVPEDLSDMVSFINNKGRRCNLSVGIPKFAVYDRTGDYAIEQYKKCNYPIHFLGLIDSFDELNPVKDLIRSCDTSQLAFMAKNMWHLVRDDPYRGDGVLTFKRSRSSGTPIDLEHDVCSDIYLEELISQFNKESKTC